MKFAALDLGTRAGYAINRIGAPPFFGVVDMHSLSGLGTRFGHFRRFLSDLIQRERPDLICFESPLPPAAQSSIQACRIAYGLAGHVEEMAWLFDVRCVEVQNAEHKRHFVGKGNAKKAQIMEECLRRGWAPPSQDAADAGSVLAYLVKVYTGVEFYTHA